MTTPPHRRWFQFGLGTMFAVMTLFAVWLAWGLHWMHTRETTLQWFKSVQNVTPSPTALPAENLPPHLRRPWKKMPLTLRLLGAEPIGVIDIPQMNFSRADCDYIQALFPEATVLGP